MSISDFLTWWRLLWRKGITLEQLRQVVTDAAKEAAEAHFQRQRRLAAQRAAGNAAPREYDDEPPARAQTRAVRGLGAPRMPTPNDTAHDVMFGGHGFNIMNVLLSVMPVLGGLSAMFGHMVADQAVRPATAKAASGGRRGENAGDGRAAALAQPARRPPNSRYGGGAGAPANPLPRPGDPRQDGGAVAPMRERPLELAQADWEERWARMTPGQRRREAMEQDSLRRTDGQTPDLYRQLADPLLNCTGAEGLRPALDKAALQTFVPGLPEWLRDAQNHPSFIAMRATLRQEIDIAQAAENARAAAEHRPPSGFSRDRLAYVVYEHADDFALAVGEWLRWRHESEASCEPAATDVAPSTDGDSDGGGHDHNPPRPDEPQPPSPRR